MSVQPIEVYSITALDLLVAWLAWVVITLAAVVFTVWLLRPDHRDCGGRAAGGVDSERTVEIRPRRRRPPHTGVECRPPDETTVILPGREGVPW